MRVNAAGRSILFFGTPDWAVPTLEALHRAGFDVSLVVTNPDRPAGRGYALRPPAVKLAAERLSFPVAQPPSMRDEAALELVASQAPEVVVVVAYGKILPGEMLKIPRRGFVNLHFSLLPEYRGAAPVQRAIMDGRAETGVSVMVLTEGMDEGPVLATRRVEIDPDETAGELGERLAEMGASLVVSTLDDYLAGELEPEEQDHDAASYAPKVTSEEARIDWDQPAVRIRDKVRGLNPVPGAWTSFRGKRLKLHRVRLAEGGSLAPAENVFMEDRWLIGTSDGLLEVVEAQAQGKKRMPGPELGRGLRFEPGEMFDPPEAA